MSREPGKSKQTTLFQTWGYEGNRLTSQAATADQQVLLLVTVHIPVPDGVYSMTTGIHY